MVVGDVVEWKSGDDMNDEEHGTVTKQREGGIVKKRRDASSEARVSGERAGLRRKISSGGAGR